MRLLTKPSRRRLFFAALPLSDVVRRPFQWGYKMRLKSEVISHVVLRLTSGNESFITFRCREMLKGWLPHDVFSGRAERTPKYKRIPQSQASAMVFQLHRSYWPRDPNDLQVPQTKGCHWPMGPRRHRFQLAAPANFSGNPKCLGFSLMAIIVKKKVGRERERLSEKQCHGVPV